MKRNQKKIIDSENELELLINQERKRPKIKKQILIRDSKYVKPLIIDGSDICYYNSKGFPSFKTLLVAAQECILHDYTPMTIICDSELKYLLIEHENIENLKKCTCEFCTALNNQYIEVGGKIKVPFYECDPHKDVNKEILENASNQGARILTNKDYSNYIEKFSILTNPNWKISYKLEGKEKFILVEHSK